MEKLNYNFNNLLNFLCLRILIILQTVLQEKYSQTKNYSDTRYYFFIFY